MTLPEGPPGVSYVPVLSSDGILLLLGSPSDHAIYLPELAYHYRAALSVTILYELQKVITLGVT